MKALSKWLKTHVMEISVKQLEIYKCLILTVIALTLVGMWISARTPRGSDQIPLVRVQGGRVEIDGGHVDVEGTVEVDGGHVDVDNYYTPLRVEVENTLPIDVSIKR